jgi:CobQ-like glutamine amidotransferase family enzyme
MEKAVREQSGARFFDEKNQDRGWASRVTRRSQTLGGLTILDVVTSEPSLARFLTAIDRSQLSVQHTDTAGDSYIFKWASGYENGAGIRIQGVLDPT